MYFVRGLQLCVLFVVYLFAFETANAVEVQDYNDFIQGYRGSDDEIVLENDIHAEDNLGSLSKDLNINGNGHKFFGDGHSGIVLNSGKLSMENITADNFQDGNGGFIYNNSTIEKLNGDYLNNVSDTDAGMLFNNSYVNEMKGNFNGNSANYNGGAVYNSFSGTIENIEGKFENNQSVQSEGGAIFNLGNIYNIDADFIGNSAGTSGGAISNWGDIKALNGKFSDNYSAQNGGAIYNYGIIENLSGKFTNNSTEGRGGAICNMYGTIDINSDNYAVEFTGNRDSTGLNAIYNNGGTINFNGGNNDIIINDNIDGNYGTLNFNGGNIHINNEVSGNTVNLSDGTLYFGTNNQDGADYFGNFNNTVDFNIFGGVIDLRNNNLQNTNFGNLTLNSDMNLMLDADLENLNSDTFTADSFNSNNFHINICDINIMSPTTLDHFCICPIGDCVSEELRQALCSSVDCSVGEVNTPIYKYRTFYEHSTGMINFYRIKDSFSPSILSAPVAAQLGGYLVQLNSYNEAFGNMDMYMSPMFNQAYLNSYASAYTNSNPSKTYYDGKYIWGRPYSVFESVPLKNFMNVSNIGYGTFFGNEMPIMKLKKGWSIIWGPYAGYNGSHQTFESNGIYQNGGTAGVVAMAYKKQFFGGLTVNAGANACEADTMFGKDNFGMFMTGAALKTGYNFHFKENRCVIQPNLMLSYSMVNTFNYTNASGVKINSDTLNAVQIAPGIKYFQNMKNGWQPYASVSMVWNAIDKAKFRANDVSLPVLSIKPFVAYGAGVRKYWGENSSAYFQVYVVNGGRNGAGISFGYRRRI